MPLFMLEIEMINLKYNSIMNKKQNLSLIFIQSMKNSACTYIVIYGCVKKTQMLKGERAGLQFKSISI
jgi:hypothetical protein